MFKDFLMKKMLKAKGVPEEQADMMMDLISKNPELFKKIGEEIQQKMKQGGDQMQIAMEVMAKYKDELEKIAPR